MGWVELDAIIFQMYVSEYIYDSFELILWSYVSVPA